MMDIVKYSKAIKYLSIIPVLAGVLTFVEIILPYKSLDTEVISKRENYRAKTNSTTYKINFKGITDEFTEEIYASLNSGDKVIVKATYFNRQIREVVKLPEEKLYLNSTSEPYFLYGFAIVFLLSGLVLFKKNQLEKGQATISVFIIVLGTIQLLRMFL